MAEPKNIHKVKQFLPYKEKKSVYVFSDIHWDSPKCDRKLLKKHFNEAKESDSYIIINGDFLDVMGMKHDPRSLPNQVRPEYMLPDASYLDLVIFDAVEFLKNYKDNILLIGYGNHETNIVKRQQTDPLKRIWRELGGEDSNIQLGAYKGAIIFNFNQNNNGGRGVSKWYYHHGSGGGAKRSKGILNADLLTSQNPWADVIISGHDHQKWHLPFQVKTLNVNNDKWIDKRVDILRTGSYKKKSIDFGWEIEKDFNEPTLGGYKVTFFWSDNHIKKKIEELC